ncbi:hypothetical protein GCM10011579_015870 [Streptomyces albiflavescens]|uniref:Uncharacterized protein n=1 Tax=Streptomyces albiflavescens TaxID=1623582 RepID=A0A917XX77_9ACTN|nr:hypothetical protein GCM10011579_015870 [Streptomyces albiflavescens]
MARSTSSLRSLSIAHTSRSLLAVLVTFGLALSARECQRPPAQCTAVRYGPGKGGPAMSCLTGSHG